MPGVAHGQAAGLTGSFLSSLPFAQGSGTCDRQGNSTFTFSVSGTSAGPYPGTFTETGTFTIGPHTEEIAPGQFRGRLTAFHADFKITSDAGTVTGSKDLNPDDTLARGLCSDGISASVGTNGFGLSYTAGISLPDGSRYTDTGSSGTTFDVCLQSGGCGAPTSQPRFREFFNSSGVVAEPEDPAEVLDLDSYEAGDDGAAGPVSTADPLAQDEWYVADVTGTYSAWRAASWTSPKFSVCGSPEPSPVFPSPGTTNGKVGLDADTLFARVVGRGASCTTGQRAHFQVSLGNKFTYPEPGTSSASEHAYSYFLRGAGKPAAFRLSDKPTSDNHGRLRIAVRRANDSDCADDGWRNFGSWSSQADCEAGVGADAA